MGGGYSFVSCLSHLTIDHAFLSDGAPFLLLIESLLRFGRSLRPFHLLHRNFLHILSPSCFAVRGHHLPVSPRIAFVLLLLSSAPNFAMSHSSMYSSPLRGRASRTIILYDFPPDFSCKKNAAPSTTERQKHALRQTANLPNQSLFVPVVYLTSKKAS